MPELLKILFNATFETLLDSIPPDANSEKTDQTRARRGDGGEYRKAMGSKCLEWRLTFEDCVMQGFPVPFSVLKKFLD